MSEIKHTPGPWGHSFISALSGVNGWRILDATGDFVGIVEGPVDDIGRNSNARLIAAAPELLEALKHLVSVANPHLRDETELLALGIADFAIAKAEGQS